MSPRVKAARINSEYAPIGSWIGPTSPTPMNLTASPRIETLAHPGATVRNVRSASVSLPGARRSGQGGGEGETMANPRGRVPGELHLKRDNQEWVVDYVIQQSGRVYHWWTGEEAALPPSVRSHAMVSKHLGRRGLAKEAEARAQLEAGEGDAALRGFWSATRDLIKAQHHIFEVDAEK